MSTNNPRRQPGRRMPDRRRNRSFMLLFLLLVVGIIVVAFGIVINWGHSTQHAHAAAGANIAPATGILSFTDTKDASSITIQTDSSSVDAGHFTFATASGAQYHGGQASDLSPLDSVHSGLRQLKYNGPVQLLVPSTDASTTKVTIVNVQVTGEINIMTLSANVQLTDRTNGLSFTMLSFVPATEGQAVTAYNKAATTQDWATLYASTSKTVIGDYSEAQFAQLMAQQVQSVGAITAISTTSAPQAGTNPAGIRYFTVTQQVTITLNGTSQMQSVTSVFILEDGVWRFWFSE